MFYVLKLIISKLWRRSRVLCSNEKLNNFIILLLVRRLCAWCQCWSLESSFITLIILWRLVSTNQLNWKLSKCLLDVIPADIQILHLLFNSLLYTGDFFSNYLFLYCLIKLQIIPIQFNDANSVSQLSCDKMSLLFIYQINLVLPKV